MNGSIILILQKIYNKKANATYLNKYRDVALALLLLEALYLINNFLYSMHIFSCIACTGNPLVEAIL